MRALKRSQLVWSLLICLVLVNGFMAAPSVDHAAHHGSHEAGTHTTGLCAWLCAAGQAVESSSVILNSRHQLIGRIDLYHANSLQDVFSPLVFLRGPPISFS